MIPAFETPNPKALGRRNLRWLGNALIPSDIIYQLDVVNIAFVPPSLDRFDVAAPFPIELIGESKRIVRSSWMPSDVFPGNELIPARNENQIGVARQGIIPLLLNVQPVQVGILTGILSVLLGITATVCAGCIESTAVPSACRIRILGYTDHHLLATAIRTLHILMLRIGLEPSPLVGTHRTVHNVGLPGAEGEELCDLPVLFRVGQVVGIGHDAGLSVQVKPKVLGPPRFVEVLVQHPK